jgi:excisionase family DNA binding protein
MVTADEELYTTEEIAQRLKLAEGTIRAWCSTGRIRGLYLGTDKAGWRVKASEFTRFLEEAEALGARTVKEG